MISCLLQGGRARLRVPRLDLDGKLAALAHFSATLDDDLPLSWSLSAHHGAAAAGFGAAALASPGMLRDGRSPATGSTGGSGNGSGSATSPAAADVAGSGTQISLLSPISAPAVRRTSGRGRATPGDALERRLARKRHLAAAVEADAALNPASGRGPAAAAQAAAVEGCSRQADDQQAGDAPALSPPAPAAEVAIAAARCAADDDRQPGQLQQPPRTGGLWRRMLGGLKGFS